MKIYVLRIALLAVLLIAACDVKSPSWEPYNPYDYVAALLSESPGQTISPIASLPDGAIHVRPRALVADNPKAKPGANSLYGFEHALSAKSNTYKGGTILIMPTFGDPLYATEQRKSAYSLTVAQPGYYKAKLDRYNIFTELAVTPHTALHQFTFQDGWANVFVDISSALPGMSGGMILFNGPTEIGGYTFRSDVSGGGQQKVWFVVRFERSAMAGGLFKNNHLLPQESTKVEGKNIGAYFAFRTREGGQIKLKMALSENSIEEALSYLDAEQPGWTFPLIRQRARESWQKELSRIMVYGDEENYKKLFYTALFECLNASHIAASDSTKQSAASLLDVVSGQYCRALSEHRSIAGVNMSEAALASGAAARSSRTVIDGRRAAARLTLPDNHDASGYAPWLVQTMIGLIPACPGNDYSIVPPFFKRTEIRLANGELFIIESPKADKNIDRLVSIKLNGKSLSGKLNGAAIHAKGRLIVRP